MKKMIMFAMALIMALSVTACGKYTYEKPVTISAVKNGEIYCVDADGDEWAFYGDGYTAGDNCILIMDNMGTGDYLDDEIISYK